MSKQDRSKRPSKSDSSSRRSSGSTKSFGRKSSDEEKPFRPRSSGRRKDEDSYGRSFDKSAPSSGRKKSDDEKSSGRGSFGRRKEGDSYERPSGRTYNKTERPESSSDRTPGKKRFVKRAPGESRPSGGAERSSFKSDRRYKDEPERSESRRKFDKSEPPKSDEKRTYGKTEGDRKRKYRKDDMGSDKFRRTKPASSKKYYTEPTTSKSSSDLIRLNKYISNAGICSRREADELIKQGLIRVNGEVITEMGFKVKPGDEVRYEEKKLKPEKPVYLLLNKPKGFITTSDDERDRKTVMDLVANACKEKIYPVGRLDRNTTGLLLFTNDGELAQTLTHPSYKVKKVYKVELDKALTKGDFQEIAEGVRLEEGRAMVDEIAYVDDSKKIIGIELHVGWNRIVRRIFETLGYEVVKLDRVIYAGLDKKDLPRGNWRFLTNEEVVRLKHFSKK